MIVADRGGGAHSLTATAALHVDVTSVNDPHTLTDAEGSVNEVSGLQPLVPIFDLREEMLSDPEDLNMRWRFSNGCGTSASPARI